MGECVSVKVDGTLCTASTTCVIVAAQLFELPSGADTAVVKLDRIEDPALIALAREAEESCPTQAILVEPAA